VPDQRVRTLRAEDALFVHVQTPQVPQQAGAVLILDPKDDGSPPTRDDAVYLFDATPGLRGRIDAGSAWRRPRWRFDATIQVDDLVSEVKLGQPDTPADLDGAMDAFFAQPVDGSRRTGEALLVHGLDAGKSALLIKVHHAAADGIAVTGALVARCRGKDFIAEPGKASTGTGTTPLPARMSARVSLSGRLARAGELARGVATLARSGRAPRSKLNGPVPSAARHHARVELPAAEIRAVGRVLRARTTDVATGLLAEALHRALYAEAGPGAPESLRVMMPRSTRTTTTFRHAGNHTGAASVDLPVGPMTVAERVARTRAAMSAQVNASTPHAAHAVVWALGLLPPWPHARLARLVYRSTWFNAIASVLPGARSPVLLHGSRVSAVFPVLALAPGVGLSVGIMTWADLVTFCFTGDARTAAIVDGLADAVTAASQELRAASLCTPL